MCVQEIRGIRVSPLLFEFPAAQYLHGRARKMGGNWVKWPISSRILSFRAICDRAPEVAGGPQIFSAILNFRRLSIIRRMVENSWQFQLPMSEPICANVGKLLQIQEIQSAF